MVFAASSARKGFRTFVSTFGEELRKNEWFERIRNKTNFWIRILSRNDLEVPFVQTDFWLWGVFFRWELRDISTNWRWRSWKWLHWNWSERRRTSKRTENNPKTLSVSPCARTVLSMFSKRIVSWWLSMTADDDCRCHTTVDMMTVADCQWPSMMSVEDECLSVTVDDDWWRWLSMTVADNQWPSMMSVEDECLLVTVDDCRWWLLKRTVDDCRWQSMTIHDECWRWVSVGNCRWLSMTVADYQWPSMIECWRWVSVGDCRWLSVMTVEEDCRWLSMTIHNECWRWVSVGDCQWLSVMTDCQWWLLKRTVDDCRWLSMTINDECWRWVSINDHQRLSMMTVDDCEWLSVTVGDDCLLVTINDCRWWLLRTVDDCRWPSRTVMTVDERAIRHCWKWQSMIINDCRWWLSMTISDCRWLSMPINDCRWWLLMMQSMTNLNVDVQWLGGGRYFGDNPCLLSNFSKRLEVKFQEKFSRVHFPHLYLLFDSGGQRSGLVISIRKWRNRGKEGPPTIFAKFSAVETNSLSTYWETICFSGRRILAKFHGEKATHKAEVSHIRHTKEDFQHSERWTEQSNRPIFLKINSFTK
jgi:hypothetical protein